ncbi:MAG: GNAT family N-acetyltransferase [Bdellovibrionota bacterium]
MIFGPEFRKTFELQGTAFNIASLTPSDRAQIQASLKYMSHETIRNRFMGSKREFSEKELDYLTSLDGINHYAFGVEESLSPHRGVAVIRMVRSESDPTEAEVAITIIDEYQKKGLGSFLLDLLYFAAHERGISKFSFTFFPANQGIIRLIEKKGSPVITRSQDSMRMILELKQLDQNAIQKRVSSVLPGIDSGHSKT